MAENVKRKKKKTAVLIVLMALVLAVLAVVCVYETELNKLDSNDGVDNSFYDSQFKNKKVMVIVGTKKALYYAVTNVTVTKRNTLLKERLFNPWLAVGNEKK